MTNFTNKVIKQLTFNEQKEWHNKNNWSIFQDHLLSKGATTYRHPLTSTLGLDEKLLFLGNENQINHFNANPADIAKNIMVSRYGPQWEQVGADIDGEAESDETGYSVSLSADGSVMAIGLRKADTPNGDNSGKVQVYRYSKNEDGIYGWYQIGEDIIGEGINHLSGSAVSLSYDGFVLAIGAPDNSESGGEGYVKIYRYDENTEAWLKKGQKIRYETIYDETGYSVSLSADGSTVAVGSRDTQGYVRVYKFNLISDEWDKMGSNIHGEFNGDKSGTSVSLSADGSVLAIGAPMNDGNGIDSGHVRIYKYNDTDGWNQLGSDINGEAADDRAGTSVSLSADGSIVAIGAIFNDGNGSNSGHARVYKYNGSSWNKQGGDIDGEASHNEAGASVSLSADGSILAIGAKYNDGTVSDQFDNRGHVRVYQYDPNKNVAQLNNPNLENYGPVGWNRIGQDIDGEAEGDLSGAAVSLSADGSVVAIGAIYNDGNGNNSGHVRVFQIAKKNLWVQHGLDIDGESAGDKSGYSVSMSGDGSIVAIGSHYAHVEEIDDYPYPKGQVRVYRNESGLWKQLGSDIEGETADNNGISVSLSNSGSIIAIGASGFDNFRGKTRVFEYDSTKTVSQLDQTLPDYGPVGWKRLGHDIEGEAQHDHSGNPISCIDGRNENKSLIVAIGGHLNDDVDTITGDVSVYNRGHVRVYEYDSTKTDSQLDQRLSNYGPVGWNRLGQDFDGNSRHENNGKAISISADGSIIAIGAQGGDGEGTSVSDNRGYVRVYQYDGVSSWEQIGNVIYGEEPGDSSGNSVSLSADGTILAIGAKYNNGNGTRSGHVRVYEYDGASSWEQIGNDIDGESSENQSGSSISLSADGTFIAIGSNLNDGNGIRSGHVRVYRYLNDEWNKFGEDIDGEQELSESGISVSLSDDGLSIIIGAYKNDGVNGIDSGHVRVYKFTGWGLGT